MLKIVQIIQMRKRYNYHKNRWIVSIWQSRVFWCKPSILEAKVRTSQMKV